MMMNRVEQRFVAAMVSGWESAECFEDRFAPMAAALFDEAMRSRKVIAILGMLNDPPRAGRPGAAFTNKIADMYRRGQEAGAYAGGEPAIIAAIAYGMVEGAMRHLMIHGPAARPAVEACLVRGMKAAFLRHQSRS